MQAEDRIAPILSDLTESAVRLGHEHERRLGHLSELAETMVAAARAVGAKDPAALLSALAAMPPLPPPVAGEDTPAYHRASVGAALTSYAVLDRVALTQALYRRVTAQIGRPPALSDMEGGVQPLPARCRIVYVRSQLSDSALARFESVLPSPSVAERRSMREVMDDVDSGYADYGILPIYSDGLPIQSVCTDLDTYGLKLALVTYLPNGEGNVCYGLLSRTAVTPCPPRAMLLLHVPPEDGTPLSLPSALALLGGHVTRIDATPLSHDLRRCGYRVTVTADGDTLPLLLLYQTIFAPGDTVCGFFAEV